MALGVQPQLEPLEHPVDDPGPPPLVEAVVGGLPRAVAFGQVAPRGPGAQDPEHGVEQLAGVARRPPLRDLGPPRGDQVSDQLPLTIPKLVASAQGDLRPEALTRASDPVDRLLRDAFSDGA